MFDSSIVQSNTCWLVQSGCTADNQLLFSQFLEKQSEQRILESVEVDSLESGIYRVWRDSRLLGTFQRDIANGLWISQPYDYKLTPRFENSKDALMFIVEMNALAVV